MVFQIRFLVKTRRSRPSRRADHHEGGIDHDVASARQGGRMTGGRELGGCGLPSGRQHMMDKERGNE
jgi:hypothetical protein